MDEPIVGNRALSEWAKLIAEGSTESRVDAVRDLAKYGGRENAVVPLLTSAVADEHPRIRTTAAMVLGWGDWPAALIVPALTKALTDEFGGVRSEAALTLAKSGPDARDSAAALMERTKDATDIRAAAGYALACIEPDTSAGVSVLVRVLDECSHDRGKAMANLGLLGAAAGAAVPALIQALGGAYVTEATDALGKIGKAASAAAPALLARINDRDESVRRACLRSLGRIGAESAVPPLIAALADKSEYVRSAAVDGLLLLGPKAEPAIPVLLERLVGDTPDIAMYCACALGKIGRQPDVVVPWLTESLAGAEDYRVAACAAGALGAFGPAAATAVEPLVEALKSRHDFVREASAEALGCIGAAAAGAVPDLLRKINDRSGKVSGCAQRSLRAIGAPALPRRRQRCRPWTGSWSGRLR